eukprot:snap_masked-scaffold136_size321413-processed-gene-2.4 protein:Tk06263 transcript:snap_masked-scaffold136_size321413-processed-gene-2.4-mRNA-1 annotation:"achain structure of heterotrimeric g protein galpha-q beta gamma in complex with an inhibitor ym-254890"
MGQYWTKTEQSEEEAALVQSRTIDRNIRKEVWLTKNIVKVLLVGSQGSGKSTFLKQMRIIHGSGFSEEDRVAFKAAIHEQAIKALVNILEGMSHLSIEFQSSRTTLEADIFQEVSSRLTTMTLSPGLGLLMARIWRDEGVKAAYRKSRESRADDSNAYILDCLTRLSNPIFIPTNQDILQLRAKSPIPMTDEASFDLKGIHFVVKEVNADLFERGRWVSCFDDVATIIFVASLADFDILVPDLSGQNRMRKSLKLFQTICQSEFFKQIAMILFMNKVDVFRRKLISGQHLKDFLWNYKGPDQDLQASSMFLLRQFMELNAMPPKIIYTHFSCAVETPAMKFILNAVTDMVIRSHLQACHAKDLYTVTGVAPASAARIGDPKLSPFFTSRGDTYQAKVEDSVVLQCQVENLGES